MGLTEEEVRERIARGEVNVTNEKNGKSYAEIIFTNLFTFFNLVWAIISVILCCIGEYKNLTFLPVIIPNILIAIVLAIVILAGASSCFVITHTTDNY